MGGGKHRIPGSVRAQYWNNNGSGFSSFNLRSGTGDRSSDGIIHMGGRAIVPKQKSHAPKEFRNRGIVESANMLGWESALLKTFSHGAEYMARIDRAKETLEIMGVVNGGRSFIFREIDPDRWADTRNGEIGVLKDPVLDRFCILGSEDEHRRAIGIRGVREYRYFVIRKEDDKGKREIGEWAIENLPFHDRPYKLAINGKIAEAQVSKISCSFLMYPGLQHRYAVLDNAAKHEAVILGAAGAKEPARRWMEVAEAGDGEIGLLLEKGKPPVVAVGALKHDRALANAGEGAEYYVVSSLDAHGLAALLSEMTSSEYYCCYDIKYREEALSETHINNMIVADGAVQGSRTAAELKQVTEQIGGLAGQENSEAAAPMQIRGGVGTATGHNFETIGYIVDDEHKKAIILGRVEGGNFFRVYRESRWADEGEGMVGIAFDDRSRSVYVLRNREDHLWFKAKEPELCSSLSYFYWRAKVEGQEDINNAENKVKESRGFVSGYEVSFWNAAR